MRYRTITEIGDLPETGSTEEIAAQTKPAATTKEPTEYQQKAWKHRVDAPKEGTDKWQVEGNTYYDNGNATLLGGGDFAVWQQRGFATTITILSDADTSHISIFPN
jgi:hypothetical protein